MTFFVPLVVASLYVPVCVLKAHVKATAPTHKVKPSNGPLYFLHISETKSVDIPLQHRHIRIPFNSSKTDPCEGLRLADCRREPRMEPEEPYRSEIRFAERTEESRSLSISFVSQKLSPLLRAGIVDLVFYMALIPSWRASQMSWSMFPSDWRSFKCH